MNETQSELLAATFATPGDAARALATLVPGLGEGGVAMAAVVEKEAGGKVRWAETHDAGAAEGAMVGFGFGAVAGLIGFMLGPIALLGAPIGAGIGALVAKLKDSGFEDDDLSALGEDLGPGEAALVAVISAAQVEKARRLLNEVGVKRVEVRDLDAELASLLDREAEVAMANEATTEQAAPGEAEPPPTSGV